MESSLTELEELIETLDLAPQEADQIARILQKIRDEAAAP
jgi:endonuclease III